MTRSSRNHRITIINQILHLMYCRTYVNLYDAVRSVIPCDKLHKHQFSFNNDGQQRASFGWEREFQYGGNFSVSWDRNFPEINFGFTRSWRTVILSTSLKLRTYLNLRTPVLKFKYDCNSRLHSSYCKITFENLCSTK